ncbi:hypothetical protein [Aquabacterium sp.]|uniref:hypothetical protein n=1 Tax=Aquabacterium sp. TaxID=1872578 RepID=UPI0035B1C8C3
MASDRSGGWRRAASWVALSCGLALLGATPPAVAQKMYRCGSVYQDHPCAGEQPGKVIGHSGATLSEGSPKVDADCTARGVRSQKISWSREAGRTQDEQLRDAPQDTALINEVYSQRGTAGAVRAAVEASCMAAKERALQAAALTNAAAKLRGDDAAAAPSQAAPAPAANNPGNTATADDAARRRAESDAVSKKLKCGSIANRIRSIRDSQRAGGSGEAMDRLKQQLQEMEGASRDAGC